MTIAQDIMKLVVKGQKISKTIDGTYPQFFPKTNKKLNLTVL